jgi:hypothetical protein
MDHRAKKAAIPGQKGARVVSYAPMARARAWCLATNMRENGVRSPSVSCWLCHHAAVLAVDRWPDDTPVPAFGPHMVCTSCGIIGADARPNWAERPVRTSITGEHWK